MPPLYFDSPAISDHDLSMFNTSPGKIELYEETDGECPWSGTFITQQRFQNRDFTARNQLPMKSSVNDR